uniref:Uncharacterized protein n=1 Tax=Meloidogyne enterolobii TaxID=390850 RepID=A0A6V7VEM5_MELEN|nr:unnamed protein product [Meloidogyne enterolobii]
MFSTNKNLLQNSLILITVFSLISKINCQNEVNEQPQVLTDTEDFYAVDEKRVPHPGSTWRQQGRIRSFYSPTIPDFNTPYSRFTKYGHIDPCLLDTCAAFRHKKRIDLIIFK